MNFRATHTTQMGSDACRAAGMPVTVSQAAQENVVFTAKPPSKH